MFVPFSWQRCMFCRWHDHPPSFVPGSFTQEERSGARLYFWLVHHTCVVMCCLSSSISQTAVCRVQRVNEMTEKIIAYLVPELTGSDRATKEKQDFIALLGCGKLSLSLTWQQETLVRTWLYQNSLEHMVKHFEWDSSHPNVDISSWAQPPGPLQSQQKGCIWSVLEVCVTMRKLHSGVHWPDRHSLGQQSQLLMFMLQTHTFRKRASCPALLTTFRLQTLPLHAARRRHASAFTAQLTSKEHTFLKPASLLFSSHSQFKADPVCVAVLSFSENRCFRKNRWDFLSKFLHFGMSAIVRTLGATAPRNITSQHDRKGWARWS